MAHEEKKDKLKKRGAQGRLQEPSSDLSSSTFKDFEQSPPRQAEFATNRCNVKGGLLSEDKKARIIKTLKESSIPLHWKEIARTTKINPSTTRSYLKRLKEGVKVVKFSHGFYTVPENPATFRGVGLDVSSGGLGVGSYRLHCLVLRGCVEGSVVKRWVGGKACVVFDSEFFSVKIKGYASGTVVVYVDCKDEYSLDLAMFQFLQAFLSHILDVDVSGFEAKTYEFNHDLAGVKLDGVKAVTVEALGRAFKRAYQKSKGVVRVEGKDNASLSLDQVSALLQGGVPLYELVQSNAMLADAILTREQGEEGRFRIIVNELLKSYAILQALGKALLKRLNEEDATDS